MLWFMSYISRLVYRCKDGEYCVYWKNVLLHALSKDTSTFPKPCLYCQIGTGTVTHVIS